VLAIRINDVPLPKTIKQNTVDITIALPRCAGYLPGACIAGIHLSETLISNYEGSETIVPFCDPIIDNSWMQASTRFYPFYLNHSDEMVGSVYLCLNDPDGQPESPVILLDIAQNYLAYWQEHAVNLAKHHGAIAQGVAQGDIDISKDWIKHLVQQVSPEVKEKLLTIAYG
jgi:hypothetical protein